MWRWLWYCMLFIWSAVILALGLNLVSNIVTGSSLRPDIQEFLLAHLREMLLALGGLGALTVAGGIGHGLAARRKVAASLQQEFAVFKPAEQLRPEDLGFRVVAASETVGAGVERPFHRVYVSRRAVPVDRESPVYNESGLVAWLRYKREPGQTWGLVCIRLCGSCKDSLCSSRTQIGRPRQTPPLHY